MLVNTGSIVRVYIPNMGTTLNRSETTVTLTLDGWEWPVSYCDAPSNESALKILNAFCQFLNEEISYNRFQDLVDAQLKGDAAVCIQPILCG